MEKQHASTEQLAQALFIVNRHAKTAPDPRQLYTLKKKAIQQLIVDKRAKKMGLHYSDHPKMSHQHSTLLVQVSNYFFHIPPTKEDFKKLAHLGHSNQEYRNPKPKLSLSNAKRILFKYLNWDTNDLKDRNKKQTATRPKQYTPTLLTTWDKQDAWKRRR